jgi:hypothetical protein
MTWLSDSVYAIRDAAVNNLKKLTQVFGVAWSSQHVLPKVIALFSHPNYMYRMTTLMAVGAMTEVLGPDITATSLLPLVMSSRFLFHVVENNTPFLLCVDSNQRQYIVAGFQLDMPKMLQNTF